MSLRPRSVRFRLTLWYAVALAAIMFVFSAGVYFYVKANLFQQLDEQLAKDLVAIEKVLPEEPYELAEIEEHGSVHLFQVVEGERIIYRTDGWREVQLGQALKAGISSSLWSWTFPNGRSYRLRTSTIAAPTGELVVAVAQDEQAIRQSLRSLATTLMISFPLALLLSAIVGYFLAGRVLFPIGAMASKAEEITAERLSERLPVQDLQDEFGRLAVVFNRTLARLEKSFDELRRFTADASHELRTPLTAIRSVGEVGLRNNMDPAAYREVVGSMLEEADRLAGLVDSLLSLTRADSGRVKLIRERLDLGSLVQDVFDYLRVLVEEKDQVLCLDVRNRVRAEADRSTLRQALINLFDNAIKYTPSQGQIKVVVRRAVDGEAVIEIIDEGPGIPREEQGKVFERFYRVEKGRSSQTGGAGLGLAIVRWAVEVNGGRIELESEEGGGSTFRIVLPSQD